MLGHVHMMSIVITTFSRALVRPFDIPTPKEEAVGNQGPDLENVQSVTRQVIDVH